MKKDLSTVIRLGDRPVRVGVVDGEIMYCLLDLMKAVGHTSSNVTYALKKVPDMLYFTMSAINLDGGTANGKVIGVSEEGAIMALCRLSKIDLVEVYKVMKWIKRLDVEKLKGA